MICSTGLAARFQGRGDPTSHHRPQYPEFVQRQRRRVKGVNVRYRDEIRTIANSRSVRYLLHFTQAVNLAGIVRHGLLSRSELDKPEHLAYASDYVRRDGNDQAVSVSVSRLNATMFALKRKNTGNRNWVVLVLSAEVLWTHTCLFCWRNAAKKEIKEHRGWRGGPWAFSKMFDGSDQERSGLAPYEPTDPEAEVQVLEPIAPQWILGAVVNDPDMLEPVQVILNGLTGAQRPVAVDDF